MSIQRIAVLCPGGIVSGGPEVLHQLVDCLRSFGIEAAIAYYPFDAQHSKPDAYQHYDAPMCNFVDSTTTLFVIPESSTWLTKLISKAQVAIWWLSVDNYLCAKRESQFRDMWVRVKSLRNVRVPLWRLKAHLHFVQSEYASRFLKSAGLRSEFLTDYLSASHFLGATDETIRGDVIAYNPLKGRERTTALIAALPDFQFVPIRGMSPAQVAALLHRAKIYIDFGHHPGKDRLPREAAMAGCCVITNRRGSARFFEDVPIPDKYKLIDESDRHIAPFRTLATSIFRDFDSHRMDFEEYRFKIRLERAAFVAQVQRNFPQLVQVSAEA